MFPGFRGLDDTVMDDQPGLIPRSRSLDGDRVTADQAFLAQARTLRNLLQNDMAAPTTSAANRNTLFGGAPNANAETNDLTEAQIKQLIHLPSTLCFATGSVGTALGAADLLVAFLALSAATGGVGGIVLAVISSLALLGGLATIAGGGLCYLGESMVESQLDGANLFSI